tara:strand:+ start:1467 stop:1640 length:174 start_codon:yes stop_codon:yes gene_type:complete
MSNTNTNRIALAASEMTCTQLRYTILDLFNAGQDEDAAVLIAEQAKRAANWSPLATW